MRDGRARKYVEAARIMPGGQHLDDAQLAERANQLRLADLAQMRLHEHDRRRASKLAGQIAELVQRFTLLRFMAEFDRPPEPFTDDPALTEIRANLVAFTQAFTADFLALGRSVDQPPGHLMAILELSMRYLIAPVRHG
jgi:hypothetical protein